MACLTSGLATAQVEAGICGPLENGFGPFEYRQSHYKAAPGDSEPWSRKLFLVEKAHFTPRVEQLVGGASTHQIGPDLDYTLRAFPNHHRALASLTRLWERTKSTTIPGLRRPVECYFERAIRFRADDDIVRMLYAAFLIKSERRPEAKAQLDLVRDGTGNNPLTHHNLGMLYADAGLFDQALESAHRAMALGLKRRDLAQRLESAGRWREPQITQAPQSGADSQASSPAPH